MPSGSQTVVATGPGVIEIQDKPFEPLGPREVRIRTCRSLISTGTELAWLSGRKWKSADGGEIPRYPLAMGYSNAGVIVEVGEQVESLEVGDRVASMAPHASHPHIREDRAWKVPEGVDFEAATFCLLGCTVLNGVRLGRPQLGDAAAVIGLGLLGQMACQLLRLFGARPVIGLDLDDFRLSLAGRIGGLAEAVNPERTDATAAVKRLTEGRGADVVYEVTGLTETFDLAFDLARVRGTVVSLGSPRWSAPVDMIRVHLKALNVVGAIVSSHPEEGCQENRWSRRANGALFMQLLAEGALNMADLVTHRRPARDVASAYDMLRERREGCLGVILVWPEDEP